RAGSDLVPSVDSPEGRALAMWQESGQLELDVAGATVPVATLGADTPQQVRAITFSVPRASAIAFGRARLRITWDDAPHASVEAPVALFFGAGTLYNREDREYLVKALPVHIRFDAERVHLACFFPMPFERRAKIELIAPAEPVSDVRW